MTTILLTGFEPFAGDATNPSGDAVATVAAGWRGPERLVVEVLPVAFDTAAARLRALIAVHSPDIVIATGLAGGRSHVTPERVAINLADARIPDNDGAQPVDLPVVPGGPSAYFATIPVKAVAAAVADAGIPSAVSHSAGTFVCNHVMFTALDAVAPGVRAGFVHVPYARDDAPEGAPALPLADIARALEIAVRTCIEVAQDLSTPAGTLH
ncbi:pyroglutamyl-peptidase I [Microbacterium proteolyticum]|uniref:pyroglutamyl-peptidase I n=1 Tax=Microbacterium proteolyticum TaxID=1572644 RepID=UPI001FAC9A4A|nr:pyroglutamyl-peptidase I [Microbacterium proteolyticum]MCI9858593.1 pyroglutamyl-peptidase I [Microbacterium proteolyticum]